jgi:hypothetical protein
MASTRNHSRRKVLPTRYIYFHHFSFIFFENWNVCRIVLLIYFFVINRPSSTSHSSALAISLIYHLCTMHNVNSCARRSKWLKLVWLNVYWTLRTVVRCRILSHSWTLRTKCCSRGLILKHLFGFLGSLKMAMLNIEMAPTLLFLIEISTFSNIHLTWTSHVFVYAFMSIHRCVHSVQRDSPPPLSTHIIDPNSDPILKMLGRVGLNNSCVLHFPHHHSFSPHLVLLWCDVLCCALTDLEDPVKVIFHPRFLDKSNPLFPIDYEEFVRGCHLAVFPAYFEPWGWAPFFTFALANWSSRVATHYLKRLIPHICNAWRSISLGFLMCWSSLFSDTHQQKVQPWAFRQSHPTCPAFGDILRMWWIRPLAKAWDYLSLTGESTTSALSW